MRALRSPLTWATSPAPGDKHGTKNAEKICEIELELLSGSMEHLFTLCHTLQRRLALIPALPTKPSAATSVISRLLQLRRLPRHLAEHPPTPRARHRQLLLAQVEHLQRNESGLLQHKDPGICTSHALPCAACVVPWLFSRPFCRPTTTRNLHRAGETVATAGAYRDWDVFLHDTLPPMLRALPHHPELRALRKLAQHGSRRRPQRNPPALQQCACMVGCCSISPPRMPSTCRKLPTCAISAGNAGRNNGGMKARYWRRKHQPTLRVPCTACAAA